VVAFSPDGTVLLTNGRLPGGDCEVGLWDAETGRPITSLGPLDGVVAAAAFSPDGARVAVGDGSMVRIFDTGTATMLVTLPSLDDDSLVTDLAFGPDGTTLTAAVAGEGVARLFALDLDDLIGIATGRLTRSFTDTECRIYAIDPCPTLEEIRSR
jgi:WD40 repeat protein